MSYFMIEIISQMIPQELLETYGAIVKIYTKNQLIFEESGTASFYYQIIEGQVKMYNLNTEGKEFVQGFFDDGQSFGEPPLLGDFKYPATASSLIKTRLYVLNRAAFIDLLKAQPEIHMRFTTMLSNRIHYKAKTMRESSIFPPEHRILTLLNHLKFAAKHGGASYEVDLTRQQISDLTGLRTETVIRTIKKLEKAGKLSIINRKVYI